MTDGEKARLRVLILGKTGIVAELLQDLKNHPSKERRHREEAISKLIEEVRSIL